MAIVIRDLDQASMEAVASLLAGLPLQLEESDRGDLMEAKSQLFLKYVKFKLFVYLESITYIIFLMQAKYKSTVSEQRGKIVIFINW